MKLGVRATIKYVNVPARLGAHTSDNRLARTDVNAKENMTGTLLKVKKGLYAGRGEGGIVGRTGAAAQTH